MSAKSPKYTKGQYLATFCSACCHLAADTEVSADRQTTVPLLLPGCETPEHILTTTLHIRDVAEFKDSNILARSLKSSLKEIKSLFSVQGFNRM